VTAGQTLDPKAKHSQPLWREARLWSAAKRKLSFCQLRIDGDDEGTLHLDHLPSPAEARAIRRVMAIRKRRKPSGEARPDLYRHFTPDISTTLAPHIDFSGQPATRIASTYFAKV
jgi:hypothetical protein